jgi:CHAD domain-containing protein
MVQAHVEGELKFEAAAGVDLPGLDGAVSGTSVRTDTLRLRAAYYDTEGRHLQRRGITLRRRSGGQDAGWHLKLALDDARIEMQVEAGRSSSVPRELGDLVRGICLGQRLSVAARVDTERTRHEIVDEAGELVAEVADDEVWARPQVGETEPISWREVEVELGLAGDESTLRALGKRLKKAGFRPSGSGSKYARAVGEPAKHDRPARLAGLVDDYLQQQFAAIGDEDARLRLGENRVHKMRVAIRRTRSTLRVFGDLFDHEATVALDAELRWISAILGRARDIDVVRARLERRISELPEELVLGPVAADLASVLGRERARAGAAVEAAMNGRRYLSLLRAIEAWRTRPPRTGVDPKPSSVEAYLDTAGTRVRTRLRAAIESGVADDFHRARKAAKRHRYAAELAAPRLGEGATAMVEAATRLQDQLGELQDTAASRAVLLDLGKRAGAPSRTTGFAYGLMYGHEQRAADEIRHALANHHG